MTGKTGKRPSYHTKLDQENIFRLRALLSELPDYCKTYFRGN